MVKYRLATETDYENINNFHNRIYKSNRSMDQFYWEFHNAPFGKSIYVIAVDGDKVVGTNCVIPIELIGADKKTILSGKSEDTLVDPDYRGQNIFYNIYQFLFEKCEEQGIKVIWGFTSAKKPFSKLGFSIPYDHQQSLAVNKVFPAFKYLSGLNKKNSTIDKLKILGLCMYSKMSLIGGQNKSILSEFDISEDQEIINGAAELIHSNLVSLTSSFAIYQHDDFQKWRIYQNPNYYKVFTFGFYDKAKTLKALIVFNAHPNKVAYVCQSTFHSDIENREAAAMIKYASKSLFRQGIVIIRNWLFDHNPLNQKEIALYTKANHIHLKRGIGLVWKELDDLEIKPEMFLLSRISTQGVI